MRARRLGRLRPALLLLLLAGAAGRLPRAGAQQACEAGAACSAGTAAVWAGAATFAGCAAAAKQHVCLVRGLSDSGATLGLAAGAAAFPGGARLAKGSCAAPCGAVEQVTFPGSAGPAETFQVREGGAGE